MASLQAVRTLRADPSRTSCGPIATEATSSPAGPPAESSTDLTAKMSKLKSLADADKALISTLQAKIEDPKKELEHRAVTIAAIQRNFENLSSVAHADRQELSALREAEVRRRDESLAAAEELERLRAEVFELRKVREVAASTQDELAAANVIVEETLQSISTVKSFVGEAYEVNRYGKGLEKVVRVALEAAKYRGAFISFIIFALFGGIVGVMWYGASLVASGEMSVGELVSFVLYTTFIGGSIAGLGDIYSQLQKAIGSSERVVELLAEEEEAGIGVQIAAINGTIEFDEVGFHYPTRPEVEVLKGVSFKIQSGEKVALVGPSGAGKSTIIHLLLRFYEVAKGQIWIDGEPISHWNLASLRSKIGIVPQEVLLFGGSIRENIAYAKPTATEEEIILAAKKANAWQFISQFPEGLDTLVGERGIKLSGGQRQRVAIARAILKDPAILILDEATSSLDAESEALVQEALNELMKGRTTLIIAHRLATIRKVDRIYVLTDGKIVEEGSHQELVQDASGIYANLVRLQFAD